MGWRGKTKVRCIKEFKYGKILSDDYISTLTKLHDTEIGKVYETESNGVTENVYDKNGNYVIAVDHERFFEYFEIID